MARRLPFFLRLLPATAPLRSISYTCGRGAPQRLIVFLPGIGDVLEDYELNGFVAAARSCDSYADMIAADLHLGYYIRRSAIERLRADVILPAREAGYRQIDLVGISLGGFGALYYAMRHPHDISNLCLLAPYLGEVTVINEISRARGVSNWEPAAIAKDDYERELWNWIKGYSYGGRRLPRIYLGYGRHDIFALANDLLAQLLPASDVLVVPGGHDWPTWIRLWRKLAERIESAPIRLEAPHRP